MTSSSDRREEQTEIIITAQNAGKRLDAVLAAETEGLSRSFLQKLFEEGKVLKNGKLCSKKKKVQRVTVSWWKSRLRNGWK